MTVSGAESASGSIALTLAVKPTRGSAVATNYIASVGPAPSADGALHRQTKVVQIHAEHEASWPTATFDNLACTELDIWVLACNGAGCSDKRHVTRQPPVCDSDGVVAAAAAAPTPGLSEAAQAALNAAGLSPAEREAVAAGLAKAAARSVPPPPRAPPPPRPLCDQLRERRTLPRTVEKHFCIDYHDDKATCNIFYATLGNGSLVLCEYRVASPGVDAGCFPRHPAFFCSPPPAPPHPPPPPPACAPLLKGRVNGKPADQWCPAFKDDKKACEAHYTQDVAAGAMPKLCMWDEAQKPACFASDAVLCVGTGDPAAEAAAVAAAAPAAAAAALAAATTVAPPAVAGAWVPGAPKEACTPLKSDGMTDIDYLDCKSWCGPWEEAKHDDHCNSCKCKGCTYCRSKGG